MSADAPIRVLRATPDLDRELRRFTSEVGTGRGLQLALDRSPSFFQALEVEGMDPAVAAFVVEDQLTGGRRVVGTGIMTEKQVFLDGERVPSWVGQLGSARIDPRYRRGLVVARCFREMESWHRERRSRVFLTTILEDNQLARSVFESGRAGIPRYRDWGRLVTLNHAIGARARSPWARLSSRDFEVAPAGDDDVPALVEFWEREGPRRQFFPAYDERQLREGHGLLRGLGPEDVWVARARRGAEIVGTLAIWDQRAFRRWLICGYPAALRWSRPLLNLLARTGMTLPLPAVGAAVDQRFVAALCVKDDETAIFASLADAAFAQLKRAGGAWLAMGLHERDPLLAIARRGRPREIHSRLYVVHWNTGESMAAGLDRNRCPYVEVAAL